METIQIYALQKLAEILKRILDTWEDSREKPPHKAGVKNFQRAE